MLASATCGLVSNVHACVKSSWYSACCVALSLQPISDRVAALSRHKIRRMMSHVFIVHWLLNLMYRSSPTGEDIVRQWSTYGRQIKGTLPSIQRLWGTQFSFDFGNCSHPALALHQRFIFCQSVVDRPHQPTYWAKNFLASEFHQMLRMFYMCIQYMYMALNLHYLKSSV